MSTQKTQDYSDKLINLVRWRDTEPVYKKFIIFRYPAIKKSFQNAINNREIKTLSMRQAET